VRILITNIVVLNGGDGAILFGMLKALKRAFGDDCEITVFASEPLVAKRMYPEIDFRETLGLAATRAPQTRYLGRIVRTVRSALYLAATWCRVNHMGFMARLPLPTERAQDLETYARADLVISSGGTYLKEEYGLVSQICDYRMTLLLRRPLAFFTQTLGPFTRPESRARMRPILNSARCILLRDERSRQNLLDIGVDVGGIQFSADAAFALADPGVLEAAKHRTLPTNRPLRVAISVRHWPHFKTMSTAEGMNRYVEMVAGVTEWLVKTLSAEVTFLSTCQGIPEYQDDSEIACHVVERLSRDTAARVKVVREFVRFDVLLQRLPEFDLVLATRMHMGILASMAGTPAIPIVLEFKAKELFTKLGLGEWVIEVENCDVDSATDRVQGFIDAIPDLRQELFRRVECERASAMHAGMCLKESLRPALGVRANAVTDH
jgi:colanic acid/amylovoran biosynthesis protein